MTHSWFHRSIHAVLLLLACLATSPTWAQGTPWAGEWDAHWAGGGARIEMTQTANAVTGRFPLLGGAIDAQANGRSLDGKWTEDDRSGTLRFRLAPDGQTFFGRFDTGEWWSAAKVDRFARLTVMDQSSPRALLRSFILAAGRARAGVAEDIGRARSVLEFGEKAAGLTRLQRLEAARDIFDLVDLTTLHFYDIPADVADDTVRIKLAQDGTQANLPLTFHRNAAGKWRIVYPGAVALAEHRTALLARYGGRAPGRAGYLDLHGARDTMRSFLDSFGDWDGQGRLQAISTLNLSELQEATREEEGTLAAMYLKHVLDRVSLIIMQEIPDDPADRNAYVHFVHPVGTIAIAPTGTDPAAPWKFTPASVRAARDIYGAIGSMSVVPGGVSRSPETPFFALRHQVVLNAPFLLHRFGATEDWQLVAAFLVVVLGFALSVLVTWSFIRLLHALLPPAAAPSERRLRWPLRLLLTAIIWKIATRFLGLPFAFRHVSDGVSAIVIAITAVWSGWQLLDALSAGAARRADMKTRTLDEISVSMLVFLLRVVMVIAGVIYVANTLSIPYDGVIAGLGIGGLAVAFASKETISNVFGAGILVIDKPFRRGDTIVAGDTKGVVEHVGIRSTRIRTAEDSVIVVPNGKLSDATINNLGSRRYRLVTMSLVLPFSTDPRDVDAFTSALRDVLDQNAKVVPDKTQVGVTTLTPAGFQIDAVFYLDVVSGADERATRHELMLGILRLGDRMGVPVGNGHTPRGTPLGPAPEMPPPEMPALEMIDKAA